MITSIVGWWEPRRGGRVVWLLSGWKIRCRRLVAVAVAASASACLYLPRKDVNTVLFLFHFTQYTKSNGLLLSFPRLQNPLQWVQPFVWRVRRGFWLTVELHLRAFSFSPHSELRFISCLWKSAPLVGFYSHCSKHWGQLSLPEPDGYGENRLIKACEDLSTMACQLYAPQPGLTLSLTHTHTYTCVFFVMNPWVRTMSHIPWLKQLVHRNHSRCGDVQINPSVCVEKQAQLSHCVMLAWHSYLKLIDWRSRSYLLMAPVRNL